MGAKIQTGCHVHLLFCLGLLLLFGQLQQQMILRVAAMCRQPVYVVAHRCNDPDEVAEAVKAHPGLNAIEADFSYGARTVFVDPEWAVEHDFVIPTSTYMSNWMPTVKDEIYRAGTTLSLILIDIKDPTGPLLSLYNQLRSGLGSDIYLLFSIPDWSERYQFNQIKSQLVADLRAGAAIDFLKGGDAEQTQANVEAFFKEIGISRYWYGDGYNAASATPDSVRINMHDGIAIRDSSSDCTNFHGAYTWTYESECSYAEFLHMDSRGVNAIFGNSVTCNGYASPATAVSPDVAIKIAKALPDKFFATPLDSPFEHSVPTVTAPTSILPECSETGGSSVSNSEIKSFLSKATATSTRCDDLQITNDALSISFFPLGQSKIVTFTAKDSSACSKSDTDTASVTVVDTKAPTITCPASIVVDPVSPQGTAVTFAATASDVCDAAPTTSCPGSGSKFPVGTVTPVTCTSKDSSTNSATCSFTVKVRSPQEVLANLSNAVNLLPNLTTGQRSTLQSLIADIFDAISKNGNKATICAQINAFISKVQQFKNLFVISAADAAPLLTSAMNLRSTFAC